ncbi:glucuronate isomerase [Lutibacter sp. HS1-25]|uniref:glucuronate isomerase n=1 Tax=Lutibacter sp. HS1-25 TaxID=2485000 RepID=UPI001010861E|nr:glucuronate isomerase [Lutibacter sp. HS1-25]RXP51966.1 glucuronate isomerase [Lutibacter sp. HS1-25]
MNNQPFINDNFLLENNTAQKLYHDFVADLPIIDYHNHLCPKQVADNKIFNTITDCWLGGDHYKWRAMRANAIPEKYITGNSTDQEKFSKWAETVPYTMCNPLYHWTHLELKRYFGIDNLLNPASGSIIYNSANEQLNTSNFSTQGLIKKMNVEVICTTDDPADSLAFHQKVFNESHTFKMLPTFRPDNYMAIQHPDFIKRLEKLGAISNINIDKFDDLLAALESRIAFFDALGGKLSDHGLSQLHAVDFTASELNAILDKRFSENEISTIEAQKFQSAVLFHLAKMYHKKGWTMQLHLGPIRNNNTRLVNLIGNDAGCDSIDDLEQAAGLSHFLNKLEVEESLPKTILYNLNPKDNEVFATMAGNFQDSSIASKIQWGSGWWFLDQKDGIEKQLNTLSNMGLISRFVGMLTDSRSFLSFPRHEYFRRILCNVIGTQIEKGELPNDMQWIGNMVANISYHNAKEYFKF